MRMILIPFFVFFMLAPYFEGYGNYIATAIFIIASLTDMLDGKIARKYNLVTDFGKFMDPLADKLLVCSAMICLIEKGQLAAWIVIIIIAREFIISDTTVSAKAMYVRTVPSTAKNEFGIFKISTITISIWNVVLNLPQ